jgi:hypothetical protein
MQVVFRQNQKIRHELFIYLGVYTKIKFLQKKRKNHCMYGRGRGSVVKILR